MTLDHIGKKDVRHEVAVRARDGARTEGADMGSVDPAGTERLLSETTGDGLGPVSDATRVGGLVVRPASPRTLRLEGELDAASAEALHQLLASRAEEGGDITLDIERLEFMDSQGLRVLIETANALGERGRLVLVEPSRTVRRLFDVTQIWRLPNLEVQTDSSD